MPVACLWKQPTGWSGSEAELPTQWRSAFYCLFPGLGVAAHGSLPFGPAKILYEVIILKCLI